MQDISNVVASQIMHSPVVCASPDDTLKQIEGQMEDKQISGMPVVEDGVMVGIITQDDLVQVPTMLDAMARYVYGEMQSSGPMFQGEDADDDGVPDNLSFRGRIPNMQVREVMARGVVTCKPSTPVEEVMRLMVSHHIHRVVVTDDGHPIGIISTLDALKALTGVKESE
ncbi:MAG: CBS domain-containing protein [Planctomycetota bacterium]|nr:CBS domain-containing protein [Planctomycetota bacterium]